MGKSKYRQFSRVEQRALATWAADCAKRVLPLFEKACPGDERLREAIKACRRWVRTGVFKMAAIRHASLSAHAAARELIEIDAACFAARAAGQAVGTAHVAQHAYGGAYYALKAVAAAHPAKAEVQVAKERDWQAKRLPKHLRQTIMSRLVVEKDVRGVRIKIIKSAGF